MNDSSLPRFILTCGIAALLAGTATYSYAADDVWMGGTSSDYNDPSNWSLGVVPSEANGNQPVINTNTGNIATLSSGNDTAGNDVVIGRGGGSNGQLNETGGSLSTSAGGGWFFVGDGGGNGTFNLADTTTTADTLTGYGTGTGSVNTNGGRFYVGSGSASTAGTNVANVNTTGSITVGGQFFVAEANGVKSVLNMDNGTINMATDFYLGGGNTGTTGTLNLSGGTITRTGGWSFVGGDLNGSGGATGTINISGGTLDESNGGDTLFGRGTGSVGNLNMTGGTFKGGTLHFGENANTVGNGNDGAGSSTAIIGGNATVSSTGNLIVGDGNGATGTFTMGGNSTVAVGAELWIGEASANNNTFTMNSGSVTVTSFVDVGRAATGNGTLTINGGTFTKTAGGGGSFYVSTVGATSGLVNLNGGVLAVPAVINDAGTGTFNFNGGTLRANAASTTFFQVAVDNVRNGGAVIDTNGFNITVAQALTHSIIGGDNAIDGGLTKNGTGTLTLSAANTYTGVTKVNAGTLGLAVTNAAQATSGITVNNTGTLLLSANNALATPTASTGAGNAVAGTTATPQVPVTLASGTLLLNGAGVNLGSGSTVGAGALTLTASSILDFGTAGVSTLNFNGFAPGGFTLSISDYTRATSTSVAGVDNTDDRLIFNQQLSAGQLADITFDGVGATEFVLSNGEFEVVPVPEPTTILGGLLALGALGASQRRRVVSWLRLPRLT